MDLSPIIAQEAEASHPVSQAVQCQINSPCPNTKLPSLSNKNMNSTMPILKILSILVLIPSRFPIPESLYTPNTTPSPPNPPHKHLLAWYPSRSQHDGTVKWKEPSHQFPNQDLMLIHLLLHELYDLIRRLHLP